MEEGVPYQTLIASVLHEYVTGRFQEHGSGSPPKASKRKTSRRSETHKAS